MNRNFGFQLVLAMMLVQTSTALMTLSSVELITTVSVSLQCIMAYNTPIFGCQIGSFTRGNSCSDQCKRALETAQSNIRLACEGLSTPRGSLIYQAQNGNLVQALCNDDHGRPSSIPSNPGEKHTTIRMSVSSCSISSSKTAAITRVTTTPAEPTSESSQTTQTQTTEEETTSSSLSISSESPISASEQETRITLEPPKATSSSSAVVAVATPTKVVGGYVPPSDGGGDPFGMLPFFSSARQVECSVVLCAAIIVMAFLV